MSYKLDSRDVRSLRSAVNGAYAKTRTPRNDLAIAGAGWVMALVHDRRVPWDVWSDFPQPANALLFDCAAAVASRNLSRG